jgi:hypothetical protein
MQKSCSGWVENAFINKVKAECAEDEEDVVAILIK